MNTLQFMYLVPVHTSDYCSNENEGTETRSKSVAELQRHNVISKGTLQKTLSHDWMCCKFQGKNQDQTTVVGGVCLQHNCQESQGL